MAERYKNLVAGEWVDARTGEVLNDINPANTRYGLSASVVTRSLEAAHAFARGVEVGCVAVDLPAVGWNVHVPFGGFKDLGLVFKERGAEGLQFYTRVKSVAMRVAGI